MDQSGCQKSTIENKKLRLKKKVGWITGSQSMRVTREGTLVTKSGLATKTIQVIWSFPKSHKGLGSSGRARILALAGANFWLCLVSLL